MMVHSDYCYCNQVKFTPTNGTVSIKCATELNGTSNESNIISRVMGSIMHYSKIIAIAYIACQVGVDVVGLLRVDVTDSGVGIALEVQGRVFGEFNQFDRNNLQGGGE